MIELLTVHTYIENEVMYPRVRELLPDLEDDVLESYEEHHVADVLVVELAAMKPDAERFAAKTTVLIENVRHHMDEEEQDWFPKVREGLGRKPLQELGARDARGRRRRRRASPSQPSALKKTIDAVIAELFQAWPSLAGMSDLQCAATVLLVPPGNPRQPRARSDRALRDARLAAGLHQPRSCDRADGRDRRRGTGVPVVVRAGLDGATVGARGAGCPRGPAPRRDRSSSCCTPAPIRAGVPPDGRARGRGAASRRLAGCAVVEVAVDADGWVLRSGDGARRSALV